MNDLTPATRALLQTAREDAPSAAARARMWSGVSGGAGVATGAAAAGTGGAAKGMAFGGAAKLLVAGALFGSAVTVGLAAIALRVTPLSAPPAEDTTIQRELVMVSAPLVDTASAAAPAPKTPVLAAPAGGGHIGAPHAGRARRGDDVSDDALEQEAAILAEARGSLMRGDPEAALAAIRAEKALPHRLLEPEALALEARAMRIEGRDRDADAVEALLRSRYPQNALAH